METVDNARENSPHRIPSLDGCRAISILLVVLAHLCHTPAFQGFDPYARLVFHFGPFGVEVFFVISGFIITTLLLNEERIEWQHFDQKVLYPAGLQNLAGSLCLFTRCGCSRME